MDGITVIKITCTGGRKFPHRRVLIYETSSDQVTWDMAEARLELRCSRCGLAPRPDGMTMRGLLLLARDGGGQLDIARR